MKFYVIAQSFLLMHFSYADNIPRARDRFHAGFGQLGSDPRGGEPVDGYTYIGEGRCRSSDNAKYPWIVSLIPSDVHECGQICSMFRDVPGFQGFYYAADAIRHSWNDFDEICRCLFDLGTDTKAVMLDHKCKACFSISDPEQIVDSTGVGDIVQVNSDPDDFCYNYVGEVTPATDE